MVYPPQLTIQLRKRQLQSIIPDPAGVYGYNIKYTGLNPLSLTQVYGLLDNPWNEFTAFTQGLDKIALTWSTIQTATGTLDTGNFVPKKGVSGIVTFEREAHEFIRKWLVDDVAAPLNQIEVQITDQSCGAYVGYIIKASSLSWCEVNALCTYDVNLKQIDDYYDCIQRTLVADNWRGWFQPEPVDVFTGIVKKHPRFSYCTEHKPNAILIIEWYLLGLLGTMSVIVAIIIAVLDIIKGIVNAVISVVNTIIGWINDLITFVGAGSSHGPTILTLDFLPITDPTSAFTSMAQLYIESAGCGREHPAPLIRDYITNVCDKCGVEVDAVTADLFFAPAITITRSDGAPYTGPNPHYNACLFYPTVKKGVRRYASINLFGTSDMNTAIFYQPENQPIWALSDMLDALKKPYKMHWRILADASGTPHLYIKRKDWFSNQAPLYDFSVGGADRSKLLEGICYQPSDITLPASMNGLYQDDPADKSGHEAGHWMNGDPLSFNNTINNPIFYGILDKSSGFGATKFRLDGAQDDYIYNAGQVVLNGALLQPWTYGQMLTVFDFVRNYADYAVLLGGETVSLPKILIWDGDTANPSTPNYLNARAMRDKINIAGTVHTIGHSAYTISGLDVDIPDINPRYPAQIPTSSAVLSTFAAPSTIAALLDWDDPRTNPPQTNVIGHSLSFSPPIPGIYQVIDYFGNVVSANPAMLVNWPMFFQPYYKDTLWDWFHWIDDPYNNPKLHKNWNLKIPLCKEDIDKLGLTGDGSRAQLLCTVLLDCEFYNNGVLAEVTVSYDTGAADNTPGTGQYIELKGSV